MVYKSSQHTHNHTTVKQQEGNKNMKQNIKTE